MSFPRLKNFLLLGAAASITVTAAACGGSSRPELGVGFDVGESQILVNFPRELEDEESLHARVRRGSVDDLSCAAEFGAISRIDNNPLSGQDRPTWRGPIVDDSVFSGIYSTEWLESEPTPEMIAAALEGDYVIDACLMKGTEVVREKSFDIRRALDEPGGNGKFDGEEEERIRSTVAYAQLCEEELGDIPFFSEIGEGDWETYNCLDSTPIPTTVTDSNGNITRPDKEVDQCDDPQYIYSLCEPNADDGVTNGPRVTSGKNDEGTSWVLLCRKAKDQEGEYNDIAMIGHNPYTGKTCYFQNALYSKTDGLHVPHPADDKSSERSPQESASLWQGIHGGVGNGIECAKCHSSDAFIHTPWIDGAKDDNGDPVIPKMGVDDDFVLGYNEAPYSLVNRVGQGWAEPKHLVSPEAAACTRCHRIGADDRWMKDWNERLVGVDSSWSAITTPAHRGFESVFWMPPEVDGLEEDTWEESEYGKAMKFIRDCATDSTPCQYVAIPTDPISDDGGLPEIELEGRDLAVASLIVLGADLTDGSCPNGDCATRRCSECHSVSKSGLKRWRELTDEAWDDCGLRQDASDMSQEEALNAVNCLRIDPEDTDSVFEAAKLGILTTGVQYTDFRRVFQTAYGDNWLKHYSQFKARVGMPKGSHPKLSQKEYATLLKWFDEDLTELDNVLEDPPPPSTCTESFNTAALTSHIDNMQYEGWGAVNEDNGIRMYGCSPNADPMTCFSQLANRTSDWGNGNANGIVREITKLKFRTSFWTRSSADGRYVGNGGGNDGHRATITDLMTGTDIGVKASYDPGFFPDNSGFIFQGATGGAGICTQSMLEGETSVDFTESQCINARGINLYQHVARGVGGGDYFIINSQFTSDSGRASKDPSAYFNVGSTMKFTPMLFNGSTYEQMPETIVDSPYEGDSVLSPSSQLVVSRLSGPDGVSLGFVVRRVQATKFGQTYTINIDQELATICESGAKAGFSYDERWLVTHTYRDGKADLILIDLLTGAKHTITDMPSGVYAQFPHFRSDGWIYFLVTDGNGNEHIAASDAAIRLAN
jgi:hypothetical protein